MTTEIEAEIAAMRVANDARIASVIRLRESRDELLAAAKEAQESIEALLDDGGNDGIGRCLPALRAAIKNAEKLP